MKLKTKILITALILIGVLLAVNIFLLIKYQTTTELIPIPPIKI